MSSLKQVMQVIGSHHISNQLLDSDCDKSGGLISNGEYAWFAAGANIILYSKQLGSIVSSRSFAANQKDKSLTITFVQELHKSEERTNLLLVGCSFKSYGILFICQLPTLTTIRCIHIPNPISYISTIKNETLAQDQLCDEFKVMSTVLLVGMATGAVFAVDLRQRHIENQLRRNEIVVNELRPSKLFIIRKNEDCQEVKEMSDDSDCHLAIFLNENFCIYCKKQYSGKLNFNISSLLYNEEINTVAIGYSTGHFQLWDCKMMRTIYLLKEPKCVMPVTHITFLEPSDDPNNLCYLWVIQSDNSRLPNAMMIALTYEQRTMMSNGRLSYRVFKGNGIKLEMSLRRETGIGRCISAASLCNVNLFRNETDMDEDCEIRLFAMLMEIRQNVDASPESYIFLFDINQWYKAQMPSNINHLKVSNSYASFVKLPHNGSYLDLNISDQTLRPFGYNFRNNVEELYYPSSIYFECDCLLDTEIIRFKHAGVQQEILDQLLLKNWRLLINPSLIFSQCLQTNLRPFFWDKTDDYVNYSLPDKRSFVISIIVENKIMSVLSACAEEWKNGTYVSSEATILHLVQCLWKHVMVVKQYADKLCVPLFDYSGTQLGRKNERILNHCLSQMLCVKHFLEDLHNAYGIHIINVDYSYRVYTLNLVTQYFKAVTCFLGYGLLPESIEEDPTQKFIQCDFSSLIQYAIKRRMEFGDLPLYLIDAFVTNEPKGNKLIEQWQHEGGEATKGLYPPSNVQCLLRIYLNAALSNQVKDFITIYFLIDVCSSQEVNVTTANRMCNFAIEFDIENKGLNTLCRASWLLDHDMFEEAMDILASNNEWMVNDKSWDWYHWTVLKLLVFRKQYFWARFYFQLTKINLINIEDHKFYINLQIMNNQCFDTLIYLRARPFKEKQTLFEYFFDRCRETKKLKCLIEYLWEMEEAELFLSYLKKFDDTETLTFQLLFLLQRGRHREAIKLNQTMKASLTSNNNDVLKITSVLIDGLEKSIPNITSQNYSRLTPQSVYKKPNVVVKCMNNESKMFIMDRNKTSTLVKRKIDSSTPSNSIDLFLPANTNTRKRSPVDDIVSNEKRRKIEESSLNTPIANNEIVKPIEKQVLEILNTPLVEKTLASPSISRCSSILKTKLALNNKQIISLDIDKTSRSSIRFSLPCNDDITVKRTDPENVVNVQATDNPENESFYSVGSNDANELRNQISCDQIPITSQELLNDDSKMNISDECEKMDISEENSCSEQRQFEMYDALENDIKNKEMISSSESKECIILSSDEEDDKETPVSIKENDKEILISDDEDDKEIPVSDEEDDKEIPVSDEEYDKEISVSDEEYDQEIPISDEDEEDDKEIPLSDEEYNQDIHVSDEEDDKEISISDEDDDKETPVSASLPKNISSSVKEGIKLSTPKSVSIDKKKTLNPHRIVWNHSVLNSKSNIEKPVLKTNKVIDVISLDSDSDENEAISNSSFSEKSSDSSSGSIISEDSDLENTRYGRFKSQKRQYNEDSDDDELDEENEEGFEEEEEEEIDISEQDCEEEESEREDENVSDSHASLRKKSVLKNTSVYDLNRQTVKFDENYEEEEEKEIDISEQDCEEEEKEIDISEQDCEEEEKEIDISGQDCEEEEKEIDISEQDCEEEEREIDISGQDCEEEEKEIDISGQDCEEEEEEKEIDISEQDCEEEEKEIDISGQDCEEEEKEIDILEQDCEEEEEKEIDISEQDCEEEEVESEKEDENISDPYDSLRKKSVLKNTSVYDLDQQTVKFDENYEEEKKEIDISEQNCEEEFERKDENVSDPHASLRKNIILKNTSVYDLDQQTVKFDENYEKEDKEDDEKNYCMVNFPGNKVIGSENNDDDFENNSGVLFNNENEDNNLDNQETLEHVKNDETSENLASKSCNVNEDNFKDNHCDDTSSNKHHSFETLRKNSNPIPDDGFNHHTVIESDQVEVDINQSTPFMFGESFFGQQEIPDNKPVLLFGHVYSFENDQSNINAQFNNLDTQELVLVDTKEDISNKELEIEAEGEIQDILELESLPESNPDENIDIQNNATINVQSELEEKNDKILCDNDQNNILDNSSIQKPIYFGNIDSTQLFQIEDQTSVSIDLSKKSLELENEDLVNHESCDVLTIKQRHQSLSNESEEQINKTEGILLNNHETSINTMETPVSSCIIVAEENTCSSPQRNVETTTQSEQIINIQNEELDSKCSTSIVSCSSNIEQFDNFNDNDQLVKSKDITLQQVDTNVLISTEEKYSNDKVQISDPVSLEPNKTLVKLSTNDNPIDMSMSEKIELVSTDVTVTTQCPDISGNIQNTENEKLEKLDKSHQKNSLDIPQVENYFLRSSSRRSISITKDSSLDIPSEERQKLTPGKINLLSDPIQNQIIRKAKSISSIDTKTITTRSRAKSEPKQVQLETISSNIFRSSDMVDDNRRQVRVSLSKKKSKSQENITSIKRRSGRSKSVVPIEESIATNRKTVFGLEEIPEEDTSNAEKNISKTERVTLKRKSKFNFLTNTAKKIEHDSLNAKCQENTKLRTPRRSKSVDPDPVLTFSVVKTKPKRSSSVNILISNEEIPTQKDDLIGVLKKALKSPKKIRKRSVSESHESRKKQKTLNQVEEEKKEVAKSEYNLDESNQSSHNSNSSNSCEQLSPIAGNISQHMLYTPAKKRTKIHMANLNSENEDSSSDESTDSKRIMTRSMIQNSSVVELDPIHHTLKSEIRPLVKSKVPINRQRKLSVGTTSKTKSPKKSAASLSEKNEVLPKRKTKNIKETIVHAPIEPSIEPPTPERRMTRFQQSILEKSLQSTSIIGQDTTTNNSPASKPEKKKNIKKKNLKKSNN
ncbi:hypothetical protein AGLY_001683 [Aphis glycines]|uniref:ELYS-like domain-containing protein n=1 Tax=Aphis glycines TaxID=307491 RepID=A0A6G0U4J0_APHGL|nr:hypothetical protein AGLY_001683 [Aphis glycines]